ncbi:ESX secretion-associated protein EspG [Haloactinomyces albus]|uniref:EspG family protein n=1 Tax=Haloactinomyces albus TaxID=1352928 RepID=A0AAE3ZG97_9ACTN|nr:ESX secretion-associated protein EspG [Haloactinomyces albus]MDR7302677.1 hypothetical protein [Haloactinomyces albus]
MSGERFERILDRPVVLSYTCYDVLHHGECGEGTPKPAGLEGISPGSTNRERIRIVTEVLADLRERGLAVVDTPVRPLRDTIRLLHEPQRRIYGWYAIRGDEGTTYGGFHAAESDGCAVLAAEEDGRVLLEPVPSDVLLSTVVSLLPDAEPIADTAMVVAPERPPRRVPVKPEDEWAESGDEVRRPHSAREALQRKHDRIEELTSGPLDFAMQVGRSTRTAKGGERVCDHPLNYYAGRQGALLTVVKRARADGAEGDGAEEDGDLRRHVLPATPDVFRQELRELGRTR